jgi:hypothetical protein
MTVVKADVLQLKPGRINDFLAVVEDMKPFARRFGASNFQVSRMMIGSQDTSRCVISGEWPDYKSLGRQFIDVSQDDPEYRAVVGRLTGPDGPAVHLRMQLVTRIAEYGTLLPTKPGSHVIGRFWDVEPGRLDEFKEVVSDAAKVVQKFGTGVALGRVTIAGQLSNSIVSIAPFPDMETLGSYLDTVDSDSNAQKIIKRAYGSNAPAKQRAVRIDRVLI